MKYRFTLKWQALSCTVVATLLASPVMAQTNDSASAANGPYLGIEGGVNWEAPQDYRFEGRVIDRVNFNRSWAAGIVGGYSFASGLRPELELDARRNGLTHDGLGRDSGHDNAFSAMANLWYELRFPGGLFSALHPYVGGGVGEVRSWYSASPELGGILIARDPSTEFAYQIGAGVGYDISRKLTVSVDYRRLWSDKGTFHDTFGAALPLSGGIKQHYGADTAMLSLRYTFGGSPTPVTAEQPAPPPAPAAPPAPPAIAPAPPPPPVAAAAPACNPPAGFQVDANCHIIEQTIVLRAIDFQFNSVHLTAPAQRTLDDVATGLMKQPELVVEIQGYADSRGSANYNQHLSQLRADAVKGYLVSKGVNEAALTARGFGEANPIASNATAEGRAQNRRVAFVVTNALAHVQVKAPPATPASTQAAQQGGEQPGNVPKQ